MKLADFLQALGSSSGTPGGGAAAALTGACAAALVEMTARLNDKRLKQTSGTFRKAATLRRRLQALIASDERAFRAIQKAYPSRKTRPQTWQSALKKGVQPPLAIAEACGVVAQLAKSERARTSAWLESDRREALVLSAAAFDAAVLNVEVNLKEITDGSLARSIRGRLSRSSRHVR